MQTEIRSNGTVRIHMKPETAIEKLALEEICEYSAKGAGVRLRQQDGEIVLELGSH